MAVASVDTLKQAHRALWASGNYARTAASVAPAGRQLVERAGIGPGMDVLDVAAGDGNVAIPAARAGARVTALDLTPDLLEAGRERAETAGVEIEWVEGDAEALPFADGRFDAVVSSFGTQFAPRHEVAAAELARACRPGGTIAFTAWTPESFVGQMLRAVASYLPPPPAFASPPPLWGREEHVRDLFMGTAELDFAHGVVEFAHDSAEAYVTFMTETYGPLHTARERLSGEGRWTRLREELLALAEGANESQVAFLARSEYLIVIGRPASA